MGNKRIIDLEDSIQLDLNDYLPVYNGEPVADHPTFKRKIGDVLGLKTISVNGVTGNSIVINADNISDTVTTKKFVTAAEKTKIQLIRNDLGGSVFLAGDGTYKTVSSTGGDSTTIIVTNSGYTITDNANYLVVCDSSSVAMNVVLPSSPANKQIVKVKDTGNAGTNNITINGSGKAIEDAVVTQAIVNSDYGFIEITFIQAVNKWLVTGFVG